MGHCGRPYTREELAYFLEAVKTLRRAINNWRVAEKCVGQSLNMLSLPGLFALPNAIRECLKWLAPVCRWYFEDVEPDRQLTHWRDIPKEWMGATALLDGAALVAYRSIFGEESVCITRRGELTFPDARVVGPGMPEILVNGQLSLSAPISKMPFSVKNIESLSDACDNVLQLTVESIPVDWPSEVSKSEPTAAKTSTERRGRKLPGRRGPDAETLRRENELAADWERAHNAGVYKADFAKDTAKMTLIEFDRLLGRVYQQNKRSKQKSRADK